MNNAEELLNPPRQIERIATSHRLSWFATMQGLLFLLFILIDKSSNSAFTYLLVSIGVAVCLPSIVSVETRSSSRSPMPFLLALSWTVIGAGCFVLYVT